MPVKVMAPASSPMVIGVSRPISQLVSGHRPISDRDDGGDHALVERAHDVLGGAEADEEGADDRGHDAHARDGEGIEHQRRFELAGEIDRGQHHGGDGGHREGLEQVGRHAGAVADIVAHVVGDGGRVARVVLGDAGFDLADHVAADVGALGEDAAAETGEDRDQRGARSRGPTRLSTTMRLCSGTAMSRPRPA
ncbi:MAG: hypothetical protein WDN08_09545 [Rhizomicrobium sp.]